MTVSMAELRWALMVVCLLIFVVVFAAMLASAWIQHRKGGQEESNFHGSVAVEVSWALAPLAIVVLLVWPAARSVFGS